MTMPDDNASRNIDLTFGMGEQLADATAPEVKAGMGSVTYAPEQAGFALPHLVILQSK